MRRILVVITTSFVPYGGLTTVMMNYYRAMNKDGLHVDFASTNVLDDKVLLCELKEHHSNYYCLGDRKRHILQYMLNLGKILKKNKYDIIHVNANSATAVFELFVAKICSVKRRIVHIHTSRCNHVTLHKILYPLFSVMYTDAISCSQKAGDWIFKDGNYTILNNGIDSERFRFNELSRKRIRVQYNISDDCVLIGHVGKIYQPKNHKFMIEIFKSIHELDANTRFLLVGDGEMRNEIEALVNTYGLTEYVIFAGMQTCIEEYLSAMDLFIFPSIWEGMPLSVIEAQASGLTCFISDTIDNTVCITDTIKMLSISSVDGWIDEFNAFRINSNRVNSSRKNINDIKSSGFDTSANVEKLEELYEMRRKI